MAMAQRQVRGHEAIRVRCGAGDTPVRYGHGRMLQQGNHLTRHLDMLLPGTHWTAGRLASWARGRTAKALAAPGLQTARRLSLAHSSHQ